MNISLLLYVATLVTAFSCRSAQVSNQETQLKDGPQDQAALQGFNTYCVPCHANFGQAASIRDNGELIKQAITSGSMPIAGSPLRAQFAQHPETKALMLAFLNGPATPPSTDLPLSDVQLPPGFKISLFAKVPRARSLAVDTCEGGQAIVWVGTGGFAAPDTKVYGVIPDPSHTFAKTVKLMGQNFQNPNGVTVIPGTGTLFVAEPDKIIKYTTAKQQLLNDQPLGTGTPVVSNIPISGGTPPQKSHFWKYIRYNATDDRLYYSIGSYSNVHKRDGSFATIMRVKSNGTANEVYAKGVRNSVGFDWSPTTSDFWFTENGRDGLGDNTPADELNRLTNLGEDFGFAYCHAGDIPDPSATIREGKTCSQATAPQMKLAAHTAALGMRFYWNSDQISKLTQAIPSIFTTTFPAQYRGQIFIAEHGSWNSTVPVGARVTWVRLSPDGKTALAYQPFATGFQSANGTRWGRPVDVAPYCDGSLLVSDDKAGAIYRIYYQP